MATLNDYLPVITAKLGEIQGVLDSIDGDVTNLQTQIQTLTDLLGNLTPEQQAAMDAIVEGLDGIGVKASAIDTKTPPVGS